MNLKDRIAIVTGGSSGIGRGIALEFARRGVRVAIADIQEAPITGKYFDTDLTTTTSEEIEKFGGTSLFLRTDLADPAHVEKLIEGTAREFGGLDILVNNAAIHIVGNSEELSVEDWDRVLDVNFRGIFLTCKHAIPHLRKSKAGRVINISSILAGYGGGGPAYPASKAAILNYTKDLALELAPDSVTVNAVCPGSIETPMQDYLTRERLDQSRELTPLGRLGKPVDIARACVFLASDDAEWITGTSLVVDGGWTANIW
jgi:NAD(P)-dependent dehydrogenase (short-subunit alcohol dehydrogenase family)